MNVTNSCPPHVLFLTGVDKLSSALQAWTDASRCLHSTALLDYCWHLTGGLGNLDTYGFLFDRNTQCITQRPCPDPLALLAKILASLNWCFTENLPDRSNWCI